MRTAEELLEAQTRVGQALARARVADDRVLAVKIRESGEQLVRLLVGLVRLRRIHATNNQAFQAPSHELAANVTRLVELLGVVNIAAAEGQIYVNDVRVRFTADHEAGPELERTLARHEVAGVSFEAPLTPEDALAAAMLLVDEPSPTSPRQALRSALRAAGVPGVRVRAPLHVHFAGDAVTSSSEELAETYQRAMEVVTSAWRQADGLTGVRPLRFSRVVADLSGLASGTHLEHLALGAQDMKTPEYARHSFAVASLALSLGRAAGLPPDALSDLGIAGLFHDVGYLEEVEGGPPAHEDHGVAGLLAMLRGTTFTMATLRRAAVCLHHHADASSLGRPPLFARIVRIAEDYDSLTRIRGSGGRQLPPPDALARLVAGAGTLYDPLLLKLFVNLMGRYPPGTILELEDKRWVVVVSGARSPETFDRPLCVPLHKGSGQGAPAQIDLAQYAGSVKVRG